MFLRPLHVARVSTLSLHGVSSAAPFSRNSTDADALLNSFDHGRRIDGVKSRLGYVWRIALYTRISEVASSRRGGRRRPPRKSFAWHQASVAGTPADRRADTGRPVSRQDLPGRRRTCHRDRRWWPPLCLCKAKGRVSRLVLKRPPAIGLRSVEGSPPSVRPSVESASTGRRCSGRRGLYVVVMSRPRRTIVRINRATYHHASAPSTGKTAAAKNSDWFLSE